MANKDESVGAAAQSVFTDQAVDSDAFQRIIEQFSMVGVVYQDHTGRVRHANSAACDILGLDRSALLGKMETDPHWRLIDEDGNLFDSDKIPSALVNKHGGVITDVIMGVENPREGQNRWLRISAQAVARHASGAYSALVTFEDISDLKQVERQLRKSEQRYRLISDNSLDMIALHAPDGTYEFISPSVEQLLGYRPEELIGTNPYDLFHPNDRERIKEESHTPVVHGETANLIEYRIRKKDSEYVWFETNSKPIFDDDGTLINLQTASRDITERKLFESREQLASKVFESTIEGILVTDADGIIEFVNPGFTAITGYASEEIIGKRPNMLKSGVHSNSFYQKLWDDLHATGSWQGEIWNRRKNGETYPEWLSINAIKDENGNTQQYAGVFYDMTEIKRSQEEVEFQANYDALTGLANRNMMMERLDHALVLRNRNPSPLAVLFIDLDNFKHINDSLGHAVGDAFLKEVASRLQSMVRKDDTVARLGGDEFLIIVETITSVNDPIDMARRVLSEFREPVTTGPHELITGASIGIAFYPDDGLTGESLIQAADMAMYKAKESGKNSFCTYTPELNEAAVERMKLDGRLRKAVDAGSFELHYQPQIQLATGDVQCMEALLRWTDEDGRLIMPNSFVPLAEDTALINPIGDWVLNEACRQHMAWKEAGYISGKMSVNVSFRQFEQKFFVPRLLEVLEHHDMATCDLQLEVTESLIMQDVERAIAVMRKLGDAGVSIAMDDFGKGYSSLSNLKDFPIDTLKIDRSFLLNDDDANKSRSIIQAAISIGTSLSLKVVTEGVESQEHIEFLQSVGCEVGQGFYLGRPQTAARAAMLFRSSAEDQE